MNRAPTTIEHALLGLLASEPRTGYALMKLFASTPMAHYSGSPGALYPALRRLESAGLVRARATPGDGRGARTLELTRSGRSALERWLHAPVTVEDLMWRDEELMLRFALLEHVRGLGTTRSFLSEYAAAATDQARSVAAWRRSEGESLSRHVQLALDYGIGEYRMKARWAKRALRAFRGSAHTRTKETS